MAKKKAMPDVRNTKAQDVMSKNVVFVDGRKTVAAAIKMMRKEGVSSMIVKNRSQEDAYGIVTRKDVVNKVVDPGKDPAKVKVYEIMTKPLIMVSPGLALKYCARLMHHTGIRRAPVFDGKNIIGMLSNTDIFDAIQV
jgi:CBS domain-containing protein